MYDGKLASGQTKLAITALAFPAFSLAKFAVDFDQECTLNFAILEEVIPSWRRKDVVDKYVLPVL